MTSVGGGRGGTPCHCRWGWPAGWPAVALTQPPRAAAIIDAKGVCKPKNGSKFTEEDWNDASDLETGAYWLSKVRGVQGRRVQDCRGVGFRDPAYIPEPHTVQP